MRTLNDLPTLDSLPSDWLEGTLVSRAWLPGDPAGPCLFWASTASGEFRLLKPTEYPLT
jgi:hypothetical protein